MLQWRHDFLFVIIHIENELLLLLPLSLLRILLLIFPPTNSKYHNQYFNLSDITETTRSMFSTEAKLTCQLVLVTDRRIFLDFFQRNFSLTESTLIECYISGKDCSHRNQTSKSILPQWWLQYTDNLGLLGGHSEFS